MNLIDLILIAIVVISVISGYQRGLLQGTADIICWLGSLLLTFRYYPFVLSWIEGETVSRSIWTVPFAFIISFFFIRLVLGLVIGWLMGALPPGSHDSGVNKALGVLPGLVNGLVYAALLATFLLIVPLSDGVSARARESRLASRLLEPVAAIEEKLTPVFDEAVRKTIGRLTIEPNSEKFVSLPYRVDNPKTRPDLEEQMLGMVNEERVKQGLKPLAPDPEMQQVARAHSADMFARGYFSHHTPERKDPFDRMKDRKVRFLTAGENLALARTLVMAHEGLMNSPGHRANILQPSFGRVGIGILDGGIYGIMVTQNFRN